MCEIGSTNTGPGLDRRRIKSILNLRLTNLVITTLFLVSVMSPSSAAPSPYMIAVNPPNHRMVQSSIFFNPCGVDNEESTGSGRHGSQDPLKIVKKNLNMTISEFRNLNKTLMAIVYESTMNLTKQFIDHDLPTKQFQEFNNYRREHPHMGSDKMVPHVLTKLYEKLFHYGEAFEKLSRMIPLTESTTHIKEHRNVVLSKLKSRLKLLICEVEASINDTNAIMSFSQEHSLPHVGKDWPKNPDLTAVLTTDMSIFVQYKTFLEDWLRITREVDSLARKDRKKRPIKKRQKKSKLNKKRNIRPKQALRHQRNSLHHRKL